MGCAASSDAGAGAGGGGGAASIKSAAIDKVLSEDGKKLRSEIKILLLGSGESGKTTIVKQMKIIHANGYSRDELLEFKPIIHKNVLDSAYSILTALKRLGMEGELSDESKEHFQRIVDEWEVVPSSSSSAGSPRLSAGVALTPDLVKSITTIWRDPLVPELLERHREFYLMDNAAYFFDELERIGAQKYVPIEADVLRARSQTTGIYETRFSSGKVNIHMFDVGGQRSERKKWIHCFEAVTSIIFCVALSEYDQNLLEAEGQNRMEESLVLFESVVNSRWFINTSIILFLNKVDLFKEKLPRSPMNRYFPEYTGGDDVNKGAKYILWRFTQVNRAKLPIYPHLTCATDTGGIALVFQAVQESIFQNALKNADFI
ncbi:G protein alpha subunit [Pseudohyphozyma bogoriensis]|nr:G protein alpha subunit [Pseudohyphozyma bogoriensis]